MRLDPALAAHHPWRVHDLARDFTLIDLWEIPLTDDPARFPELQQLMVSMPHASNPIAAFLFRLREQLGRWFKWDDQHDLPIPGCVEASLTARLSDEDRRRSDEERRRVRAVPLPAEHLVNFRPIYQFANESLQEISNRTIHGLLHLSWAKGERPRIAVYVKHRGLMSRLYMAIIKPFRYVFIYPSWARAISHAWSATAA